MKISSRSYFDDLIQLRPSSCYYNDTIFTTLSPIILEKFWCFEKLNMFTEPLESYILFQMLLPPKFCNKATQFLRNGGEVKKLTWLQKVGQEHNLRIEISWSLQAVNMTQFSQL